MSTTLREMFDAITTYFNTFVVSTCDCEAPGVDPTIQPFSVGATFNVILTVRNAVNNVSLRRSS